MEHIIWFLIDIIVGSIALLIAGKLTSVQIELKEATISVGCAALVALVPSVGWLLSIVVLFYLLKRYTGAPIWPDVLLMVIVSRLVSLIAVFALADLGVF